MERHKKVIDKYKKRLLKQAHVVGIGYGVKEKGGKKTGDEALIILVDRKVPADKLKRRDLVPQSLGDYQTDVIEIGKIELQQVRTERLRPAQPGVSIGHYRISAGTLGAIVKDSSSGELMILSNNHVLANITNGRDGRAAVGDPILQPGQYDQGNAPEDVIARLERFIPLKKGASSSQCSVAIAAENLFNLFIRLLKPNYLVKFFRKEGGNLVDCALARPLKSSYVKAEILEIGEIKGVKEAEVKMKVVKSGRTSGLTSGEVLAVGASVEVALNESESAFFEDQFVTTPISKGGDSGSLVLDRENYAVGLLFAGSNRATVCNRIQNVLELLQIELMGGTGEDAVNGLPSGK